LEAFGDGEERMVRGNLFQLLANGSRKEGVFIDISAALKLDKGKTVFIHLPCQPRVLVQLIRTNRVQTVD